MATFRNLKSLVQVIQPLKFGGQGLTHVRHIKLWVRPTIYAWNTRKRIEEFKRVYPKGPSPRYEFTDWNYDSELYAFGKRIGEEFQDHLLRAALTDASYIHQYCKRQEELGLPVDQSTLVDNRELFEEGENFIRETVTSILLKEYPLLPQEAIIDIYNKLTSDSALASVCQLLGTKDIILCSEYPPSEATFVQTFKALVAAAARSSGEEKGRKFVIDFVLTQLVGKDVFEMWDIALPWTTLTQYLKKMGKGVPEPRVIGQSGPNTILSAYIIGLYDEDKKLIGKGTGETLEIAQEMAALDSLRRIFGLGRQKNGFGFLKKGERSEENKSKVKVLSP